MERVDHARRNLISSLLKIEHGNLEGYIDEGIQAASKEPELFAHFISWNQIKGKVRDSKVAYPVIALRSVSKSDRDLAENAIAHLISLSPRDLVRAYDFSKLLTQKGLAISAGYRKLLEFGLHEYLRVRESHRSWWDKTTLQHRDSMKRLYRISHHKPSKRAQEILFEGKYPEKSIFHKVANLNKMTPKEAASTILTEEIPFQVVVGSMSNIKHPDVIFALIEGMTGNQIVTNSKMLEKLGVKNDPALKGAYEAALARAKDDKKLNVLKAGVAAEKATAMGSDLLNLQSQATKQLGSIDGNWVILGDSSASMSPSIEVAKKLASMITERVSGKVWLIFFDTMPTPFDVTGKTYYQINEMAKRIRAGGGTSIGCGLEYLRSKGEEVDGIAIVSDGGDNTYPEFHQAYPKYCKQFDKEPTVYFFKVNGEDVDRLSGKVSGVETFDLTHGKMDYNSFPAIVETLRVNRYGLLDEIMGTPLLTFDIVLDGRDN